MNDRTGKRIPKLSKVRFLAGLQCHKRLYFECFHRDFADPIDQARQAVFDTGSLVGELARCLYPGGVLIVQDHFHHDEAVDSTRALLPDHCVPAIYEAGFQFDDIRTRVDILARVDNECFNLVEVKSNTSVKQDHLPDVAVQLFVLKGCGLKIDRAHLAHLNREYVYQGGEYDLAELFHVEDITEDVFEFLPDIPLALQEMRLSLQGPEPPFVETGRHCTQPYTCPFYGYCHMDQPKHHISQIPRASEKLLTILERAGINDIRYIPDDFPGLNEIQSRVRDCVANDHVHLDAALAEALGHLEYPIHFLDFETFNPALPIYVGTRPYQVIPFQWSDHVMTSDGAVTHEGFLYNGFDDPREPFTRSLLKSIGSNGSIVVYSSFEETRIRELANALPHLSRDLHALLEGRVVDLLPLVRRYYYHPDFHGSFSLKSVLPALVPDFGYDDLEISDGAQASAAYAEIVSLNTTPDRRAFLRASLLSYCKRDTEAMVRLFEKLRQ